MDPLVPEITLEELKEFRQSKSKREYYHDNKYQESVSIIVHKASYNVSFIRRKYYVP